MWSGNLRCWSTKMCGMLFWKHFFDQHQNYPFKPHLKGKIELSQTMPGWVVTYVCLLQQAGECTTGIRLQGLVVHHTDIWPVTTFHGPESYTPWWPGALECPRIKKSVSMVFVGHLVMVRFCSWCWQFDDYAQLKSRLKTGQFWENSWWLRLGHDHVAGTLKNIGKNHASPFSSVSFRKQHETTWTFRGFQGQTFSCHPVLWPKLGSTRKTGHQSTSSAQSSWISRVLKALNFYGNCDFIG